MMSRIKFTCSRHFARAFRQFFPLYSVSTLKVTKATDLANLQMLVYFETYLISYFIFQSRLTAITISEYCGIYETRMLMGVTKIYFQQFICNKSTGPGSSKGG